jgi:hypothetical protein
MDVNMKWNYKESLFFITLVKKKYEDIMLSFSVFGGNKECFEKAYKIKKDIYSLDFGENEEWKKDKLWEYMNGDIEYSQLWDFAGY